MISSFLVSCVDRRQLANPFRSAKERSGLKVTLEMLLLEGLPKCDAVCIV